MIVSLITMTNLNLIMVCCLFVCSDLRQITPNICSLCFWSHWRNEGCYSRYIVIEIYDEYNVNNHWHIQYNKSLMSPNKMKRNQIRINPIKNANVVENYFLLNLIIAYYARQILVIKKNCIKIYCDARIQNVAIMIKIWWRICVVSVTVNK